MRNEHGAVLDSNGYAPSVVQTKYITQPTDMPECFLCHCKGDVARHEIFFGSARRKKSKEDGFWVYLCPECHQGTNGVHGANGHDADMWLKRCGQLAGMKRYGWTAMEFISRYGRNYVE